MNKAFKNLFLLTVVLFLGTTAAAASEKEPLVLLIQAKGKVMYSADGKTWKDIRRNKFLHEGDRVKTGDDGGCKLISHQTGMTDLLGSNAEVEIRGQGTKVLSGAVSRETSVGNNLWGALMRKFVKVQKYTVIQRRKGDRGQAKLNTVRDITLSQDYPDLVWENAGAEYAYRVIVGEKVFDVPASSESLIRFTLDRMEPGPHDYHVRVLYEGETLYAPEEKGTLCWLSDAERKSFQKEEQQVREVGPDNGFLLGSLMDDQGLKVAAMDQYRRFLAENPDANEARLFLIKVLDDLELNELEKAEMILYHKTR